MMPKIDVLKVLRENKETLKQFNIQALYLFGSYSRKEEQESSDVDILVEFKTPPTFDQYMDLRFFLEDLMQKKVDLVTRSGIRPQIFKFVEKELIRAA
jgi:predicted nucleotidyltransferase